jgi:hypothetical protein
MVTTSDRTEIVSAAVVEHLDLHDAIHVGHSTGGGAVAHYQAGTVKAGAGTSHHDRYHALPTTRRSDVGRHASLRVGLGVCGANLLG